jgi:hypothetical protein
MVISNIYNYPEVLVTAVKNSMAEYDMKDDTKLSVTTLVGPPRIRNLMIKYKNELTIDVSSQIWNLFGSVMHKIMELSSVPNTLKEVRLEKEFNGVVISGKFDHLELIPQELTDYKFISKYAVKTVKWEYECQLNILAYLIYNVLGFKVKSLWIKSILRDFNPGDKYKHDMPDRNYVEIPVPLWEYNEIESYIKQRTEDHLNSPMRLCTVTERWNVPDTWAVMKKDAKRAYKANLETREEAEHIINQIKTPGIYTPEFRPGIDKRCTEYCDVRYYCDYWREKYKDRKELNLYSEED